MSRFDWPQDQACSASEVELDREPPAPKGPHMTDSPFLRLPPELCDQIYNLLFGWRTVHVVSESFLCFRETGSSCEMHRARKYGEEGLEREAGYVSMGEIYTDDLAFGICYEPMGERQAYEISQQVRLDDPFGLRPNCKDPFKDCRYCRRHHQCWSQAGENRLFEPEKGSSRFALLLVCSKLNREAEAVLYRNTTFSFKLAHTLRSFVQSLAPTRMQHVKTIHIEMSRDNASSSWSWVHDDIPSVMRMLTGLTTLHVNIRPAYLRLSTPHAHRAFTSGMLTSYHESVNMLQRGTLSWWKNDLALFRHRMLQNVTVVLEDDNTCPLYTNRWDVENQELDMRQSGPWTLAEKARLARLLGEKLLASWNAISADDKIADSSQYLRLLSDDY